MREIDHSENPGAEGKIILRWIFRKWDVGHGPLAGTCECGKGLSVSIKCWEFLD
jgi:hypothetical protein